MAPHETKRDVAAALIYAAGNLLENWEESYTDFNSDPPCTVEEARKIMTPWLRKLPGNAWDTRLGDPDEGEK